MTGLERNRTTLMNNEGRLFLAAFDHPQIYGVMPGLEKPFGTIDRTLDSPIDGYILNPGIMGAVDAEKVKAKKMVLRASLGGTMMSSSFPDFHEVMSSPKQALNLGADAILIMLVLGGDHDKESMIEVARTIEQFHEYSIPVMAEVLAADYSKNNDSTFIRNGARIAAELGADFVKAFYCDDFKAVVDGCPVPVVLAGGPKDKDIRNIARSVVADGAVGFAFGRNVFQSEDPVGLIKDLDRILRGGKC